ncbi:MAG: RpiB/LacA/LacB family sugar-phosphate isomerase [Acidobacteriota bacterium]
MGSAGSNKGEPSGEEKGEPNGPGKRLRVALGSDHDGYRIKEKLALLLREDRHSVKDHGVHNEEPCDYPDIVEIVCRGVLAGDADYGILVCGSAGSAIAANKLPGIRAVLGHDSYTARQSRRQENANVLCIGSRVVGEDLAAEIARVWLGVPFSDDDRHRRVLGKLRELETAYEEERRALRETLEAEDGDGA